VFGAHLVPGHVRSSSCAAQRSSSGCDHKLEREGDKGANLCQARLMIVEFPASDPQMLRLGGRLRAAREARGFTLDALAEAMHVSPDHLRRGEAGRERLNSAELYAAIMALHLPMDILFRSDGAPPARG
jgi:DNA-binding transcriptional regulator YiaG